MDINTVCNEIASNCAKLYVETNLPEYKVKGYDKLVEDFTNKYIEAYSQAKKQIKNLPTSKLKTTISKSDLGIR